jgi:lipid II isoglutaminyl synthase (glutamine-hydrolysing)
MRLLLAIWLGKLIFFLTRTFKVGGGSAAPGLYALKIEPNLVQKLSKQIPQNIIITGTNGKTTTARMLAHFLEKQNLKVIRNNTGSNLERGIASALISNSSLTGKISHRDIGVWETDEAAFNTVVFQVKPQIMVFLNAFRDQLDRYGEVDTVVKKWQDTLEKVSWPTSLLINESDPNVSYLGDVSNQKDNLDVSYFNVQGISIFHETLVNKSFQPHKPDFQAKIINKLGLEGFKLEVTNPSGKTSLNLAIPGTYHIYDLLAAYAAYYQLNLPLDGLQQVLDNFDPAFGRVEKIKIGEKDCYIFLIKNPAGTNAVLETISEELKTGDQLIFALNDNFADGTDVSWIWDAKFEILKKEGGYTLATSGTRAEDMTLRLKYAGLLAENSEVSKNLDSLISSPDQSIKRLFILPTYTALLELQKLMAEKGYKRHYWKN